MDDKKKKIVLPILLFVLYFILDYLNFSKCLGLNFRNINIELFDIIFNGVIVIVLYIVSFYYIENKQNDKDENSRNVVDVLMKKTYLECKENLELVNNSLFVEKYIIPKVDGNKTDSENKVINNLQTLPFASYDTIIELSKNGHSTKEKLEVYLFVKKEYQYLISVKITFYDLVSPQTPEQIVLSTNIKERYDNLMALLEQKL